MDYNACPHCASIGNECFQLENINPHGMASVLTGLESSTACLGHARPTSCSPFTTYYMSGGTSKNNA
ncbi:hypothetical protein TNCV_4315471 [Trichonephila clavipes]|nr:hypothetical protein TNCV_4315471 [Trichonephila clavipes]